MGLHHYSVEQIAELKVHFESLARKNGVIVLYGTVELDGKNQLNSYIKVLADPELEWEEIFAKAGKSENPFVVMDVNYFEEGDSDNLPERSEVTKDALVDNYDIVKKKLKEFESILKEAKVGDITSFDVTVNIGNFLIEQSFFSVLSEIKYFELDDYIDEDDDNDDVGEEPKVPSKAEMKSMQEKLKQMLLDDPMLLNCTNKSLRQSFLREKIDDMGLNETVAYYLFRDSQHIVELAFAQARNK